MVPEIMCFENVSQTRATAIIYEEKNELDVGRCGSMWVDVGQGGQVDGRGDARLSVCKQTVSRVFRSLNLTRPAAPEECGGFI